MCLLLRCFLFIDSFILHGLIVGDRDKISKKLFPTKARFALQPLFAVKPWGRAQPKVVKNGGNFTLFAIEEKIAVQMPKNIARRGKIQLDEWQLLFKEYLVD